MLRFLEVLINNTLIKYNKLFQIFFVNVYRGNKMVDNFIEVRQNNIASDYQFLIPEGHALESDIIMLFNNFESQIKHKMKERLRYGSYKVNIILTVILKKENDSNTEKILYIQNKAIPILHKRSIKRTIRTCKEESLEKFEKFISNGSGFVLQRCESIDLHFSQYMPFTGSSYIPTPQSLATHQAIRNVQNFDNRCFEWAILSALHPATVHSERKSHYTRYLKELNWGNLSFPIKINRITKFEKLNPNLAIFVYGWGKEGDFKGRDALYPIRISKYHDRTPIDLLYMTDGDKSHYAWITSLSRLLHNTTKHTSKIHVCRHCLHRFSSEDLLEKHRIECMGIASKPQCTRMPTPKNNILEFTNMQNQMKVPVCIYADIEAFNIPIETPNTKTQKITNQLPNSYCYIVVYSDGRSEPPVIYRGENSMHHFIETLLYTELPKINKSFKNAKPLSMTFNEEREFWNTTNCYICSKPFGLNKWQKVDRVRDHCHISGRYRGAAHYICNLRLSIKPGKTKIPVVFHNLRNFDGHLLMSAFGHFKENLTVIPNNMEKYMSITLGQFRFIDSLQFLGASLESLACNLKKDQFKLTHLHTKNHVDLVIKKGVYPYNYVDNWDRFEEEKLPHKKDFYSRLLNEDITNEDYDHAKKVWKVFHCKTFGDYHDLYLRTDVLLLADIFEDFRDMCMKVYELDSAHYISSPSFSWDAALKITGQKLELLTDIDMHLFIEKGIRGGVSMVSKRYAKANNPLCPDYDANKPTTWIINNDANNLYGLALMAPLCTSKFKWTNKFNMNNINKLLNHPVDSKTGYILEVDIECPSHLHDSHNDFPLAPENMKIQEDELSNYQVKLLSKLNTKYKPYPKLVPNLKKKEKYIIHYRNLQFYIAQGMTISKIHRVLQFRQSPWLKKYIQLNTDLRTKATSESEKAHFKLLNNAIYGKSLENVRKRQRITLVRPVGEEKKALRLLADPSFISRKIFDNNLMAIHNAKVSILLNKPIYVGFSVLELSKLHMYEYWYNEIKAEYGDRVSLLYHDTDSLLMEIETPDLASDMKNKSHLYDFSDYPIDHPNYSIENKKVVGKMKDESQGKQISEFVGLRAKMYAYKLSNQTEIKKAKGVTRVVVKKEINFDLYMNCLFNQKEEEHTMYCINSEYHKMGLYKKVKKSLSPIDTKRWIKNKGIITLAYGHYKTLSGGSSVSIGTTCSSSRTKLRCGPSSK